MADVVLSGNRDVSWRKSWTEQRWKQRILRDRPLHDLDFSMSLRSVHEILAHGRVLTAYEHYALKFLHGWGLFWGIIQNESDASLLEMRHGIQIVRFTRTLRNVRALQLGPEGLSELCEL